MSLPYPDSRAEMLERVWRLKLAEAERRYVEDRTPENRAEFLDGLRQFTALVMRGVIPREEDLPQG